MHRAEGGKLKEKRLREERQEGGKFENGLENERKGDKKVGSEGKNVEEIRKRKGK